MRVLVTILSTASTPSRFAFVALIGIGSERRQMCPFAKARARAQAHLIDDHVIRHCQSEATIIGDAAGVALICGHPTAVSGGVCRQKMALRRNRCPGSYGQAGGNAAVAA